MQTFSMYIKFIGGPKKNNTASKPSICVLKNLDKISNHSNSAVFHDLVRVSLNLILPQNVFICYRPIAKQQHYKHTFTTQPIKHFPNPLAAGRFSLQQQTIKQNPNHHHPMSAIYHQQFKTNNSTFPCENLVQKLHTPSISSKLRNYNRYSLFPSL